MGSLWQQGRRRWLPSLFCELDDLVVFIMKNYNIKMSNKIKVFYILILSRSKVTDGMGNCIFS